LDYAQQLNLYGVSATTTSAPKEAKIGCGLCVRFDARYFTRAKAVLKTGGYASFKGFYRLDFVGGTPFVTPFR
jgi:hypothetical protein